MSSSKANLARTACCRCREQKLRCSRELPNCDRCLRLGAICEFPVPPDRKVLAAFRAPPKKRKVEHSNLETIAHSSPREASGAVPSSLSPHMGNHDTAVDYGTSATCELQLSLPVQKLFQEVYFTCQFNSTLIFHQPTFSRDFEEGRLPRHVLLAIYACATIFLCPTSPHTQRHKNLLQPLGDVRALGRQWAIRAGKEVLQDIDQPSIESVQTCQMLTHYWFSAGEPKRNTMFSGIAYKAACTLGLDLKQSTVSLDETNSDSGTNDNWIEAEKSRRCFWAVWFTQRVNSDHHLIGTSYDDRIMNLPLPLGEAAFAHSGQQPSVTLSNIFEQSSKLPVKESGSPSIMAELMILIFDWARIRDLIRAKNRVSVRDWLADLFEVEGRLSAWFARLPDCFTYSKRNLYEQLVVNQQPVFIFVHALYHQCRLALHSSLVPQFSGLHLHERIPSEATSLSARIALKSAQEISELGADLLALDWDRAQIPSFVGYCMYVSASIHITFLSSRDVALETSARVNLTSSLKLLKSMKVYWTNLERLWVRINVLYGAQLSSHRASANEDRARTTGPQAHLSDLDRLAGETRDTGQLSEPLADSVLDYTLRQLKPDAKVDVCAAQELEKTLYPDDLSQLMGGNSTFPQQNSLQPLMHADSHSYSTAPDETDSGYPRTHPVSLAWNRTAAGPSPLLQSNSYDWWQLGLDNIVQPVLRYDELFGMDFIV